MSAEPDEYSRYAQCARALAERFHSAEVNEDCLRDIFTEEICNYQTIMNTEVKKCNTKKEHAGPGCAVGMQR